MSFLGFLPPEHEDGVRARVAPHDPYVVIQVHEVEHVHGPNRLPVVRLGRRGPVLHRARLHAHDERRLPREQGRRGLEAPVAVDAGHDVVATTHGYPLLVRAVARVRLGGEGLHE